MSSNEAQIVRLDDFLKMSGMVSTGGEAKLRIQSGEVTLNGEVETRRRKQLVVGDEVVFMGETLIVAWEDD
jgi:ribosome-associated protein